MVSSVTTEDEYRAAVEYFSRQSARSLTDDVQATRRHLSALNNYTGSSSIRQGRYQVAPVHTSRLSTPPTQDREPEAIGDIFDRVFERQEGIVLIPRGPYGNDMVSIRDDTCLGRGIDYHDACLDCSADENKVLASQYTFDQYGLVVTVNEKEV